MKTQLNFDQVTTRAVQVAQTVLKFTASDIASAAKRSIKSGGKTPKSKNYRFSNPGEPPLSHVGTLKNAIRYEQIDGGTYIVGAPRLGNSRALKTLEHGGQGSFTTTSYDPDYVDKRRKSARRKTKTQRIKPRAKRPYRVYSKFHPQGVVVREYLYFNSSDTWERARDSAGFQAWASTKRERFVKTVDVEARPYMRPALAKETAPNRMNARWNRAIR